MPLRRLSPHRWRRVLKGAVGAQAALLAVALALVLAREQAADAGHARQARRAYDAARAADLRWQPVRPVPRNAMARVLWRYEARRPAHWPFCGPLPPPPAAAPAPTPAPRAGPAALEDLGRVTALAADPATGKALAFEFAASGRTRTFEPGEIVRAARTDPARFRLRDVEATARGGFRVRYEVLEGARVVALLTARYEPAPTVLPHDGPLRRADEPSQGTPQRRPATGGAAAAEATEPRLRDLRPRLHVSRRDDRRRVLEVDVATFDWGRRRGAAALAELVKTHVAKDAATGRIVGLRITGLAAGARAEVFDVRRGDILVSIDDRPVRSRADALAIARSLDPKREALVKVGVERAGRLLTYRIDARDPRTKRKFPYFAYENGAGD